MKFDDWLGAGDAPEADWGSYVLKRANRGELGDGGTIDDGEGELGLLLDLPALARPYACETHRCTPGLRASRARSCCADLDVQVEPEEEQAITAAMPAVRAELQDDPRWSSDTPSCFTDGTLARPGRRCVFAGLSDDGLWCALHRAEDSMGVARGTLKPMPCRLFPLAVVDLGDTLLLTAIHRDTARALDARPARVFPCLAAEGPPLAMSERETLTDWLGAQTYDRIAAAVTDFRAP